MNNKPLKSDLDQFVISKVRDKRIEAKLSQKHLANELNVAIGFMSMSAWLLPKHNILYWPY
ncbi:hypothetical protein HDF19_13250 [Mucilaginibacter sp. E4BP6]|uniref:hypothetical protein n=1 Tax=Mucilaginibacter sp. E4BP6 TaxID=2723089 RepID=UPI0017C41E11|nr:transcriptional regulator with XRE-family HTH domain [Mucilaginibacter sp. E4BP6]